MITQINQSHDRAIADKEAKHQHNMQQMQDEMDR